MTENEQYEYSEKGEWILTEKEPLFDAADVVRFGKDLIVQKSMMTNDAGIDWLRRHFPNHRVHKVGRRELLPWHLDSTLVPLRPGFALVNPTRPSLGEKEWEFFKKNDWELIPAVEPMYDDEPKLSLCQFYGSRWWIHMNTFSIDPKTVCVLDREPVFGEQLSKLGFEVIPIPYEKVIPFGGALHCTTLDVYREGKCEDYFPKQIKGY